MVSRSARKAASKITCAEAARATGFSSPQRLRERVAEARIASVVRSGIGRLSLSDAAWCLCRDRSTIRSYISSGRLAAERSALLVAPSNWNRAYGKAWTWAILTEDLLAFGRSLGIRLASNE